MAPLLEAKFFSEISDPASIAAVKKQVPGKRSMKSVDIVLWCLFIAGILIAFLAWRFDRGVETFVDGGSPIDFAKMSIQAMDAAPTTSELKNHYKSLLLYVDDKFKNGANTDNDTDQGGRKAMCLVSSLGQILFNRPTLRENFVVEDVLKNWPKWASPLNPAIKDTVPSIDVANTSRIKILAFLQKNFPQVDTTDEDTGSTVRNLYTDIGKRFFFGADEPVTLRDDLLKKPLTNNLASC